MFIVLNRLPTSCADTVIELWLLQCLDIALAALNGEIISYGTCTWDIVALISNSALRSGADKLTTSQHLSSPYHN